MKPPEGNHMTKIIPDIRGRLQDLYERLLYHYDYDLYYLKATKSNVRDNPKGSVGPEDLFEEMREWQFNYVIDQGLKRDDHFLDLGCGVLRGGIPVIDYLDEGRYFGMDISIDAIEVGRNEIARHELRHKNPVLVNNSDLEFEDVAWKGVRFDFIWAQSVITHLPGFKVEELLSNVNSVLDDDGVFHATIWESDDNDTEMGLHRYDYWYRLGYLNELASENGLTVSRVNVIHPNGLQPVKFEPISR